MLLCASQILGGQREGRLVLLHGRNTQAAQRAGDRAA